ncbi:hypothetical protein LCGC14_1323190 [marine sediment metagenome]|uniref:Uncharacterized protein n=1 Tax=marine sediment metagenome TaxID=412755 RepID=A0A0F9KIW5_9ZZZZ
MFQKFKQWKIQRYMKKQAKLRKNAEAKKKIAIYKHLQELYGFVKHLNTNILPNRRAKKSFWIRINKEEGLLEKTMELLIEKYKSTKLCKCKLPKVKVVCNGCGKEVKTSKEEKTKKEEKK